MSLLAFIVRTAEESYPELLTVSAELPHVDLAAKVSLSRILQRMASARRGLEEVETELQQQQQTGSTADPYRAVFQPWLQKRRPQFEVCLCCSVRFWILFSRAPSCIVCARLR